MNRNYVIFGIIAFVVLLVVLAPLAYDAIVARGSTPTPEPEDTVRVPFESRVAGLTFEAEAGSAANLLLPNTSLYIEYSSNESGRTCFDNGYYAWNAFPACTSARSYSISSTERRQPQVMVSTELRKDWLSLRDRSDYAGYLLFADSEETESFMSDVAKFFDHHNGKYGFEGQLTNITVQWYSDGELADVPAAELRVNRVRDIYDLGYPPDDHIIFVPMDDILFVRASTSELDPSDLTLPSR